MLLARASAQQVTSLYRDRAGPAVLRDRQPGQAVPPVADARAARHLRVRGPRRADGVVVGRDRAGAARSPAGSRDRGLDAFRQHRNARRHLECLVRDLHDAEGSPITSPKARYLQWRAVLSGTRRRSGPDVDHRRLSAAQSSSAGPLDHRSPAGHRVPETVQHGRSGPGRLRQSDDAGSQARAGRAEPQSGAARHRWAAARYQKGLQTLVWRADDENDDDLSYDVLVPARGRRRLEGAAAQMSPTRFSCGTRRRCRTAPISCKIVASDAPSNPSATALAGELESIAFDVDNTPPQIVVGAARVDGNRTIVVVRRQGRPLADSARGVFAGRRSTGEPCSRSTASRTRNPNTTRWRLTARSARAA